MAPAGNLPDTLVDSGSSGITSTRSQSDYDPSVSGDERRRGSITGIQKQKSKPRWFTQVKDWLSVSEPSAQAMKQQKRNTYKKHGLDLNDPQAAAKLHLPIGKLPEGAITSTRGPDPEEVLTKAIKQKQMRQSYSGYSNASHSKSSSIFSTPSAKEPNHVAPWET
ncbi:Fc.00g068250.m01.CDS01 [Cosmosporella sp. VM-42]